MKLLYILSFFLLITFFCKAQSTSQNVFIITLDGTRWQEIFKGADAELLSNTSYVKDTSPYVAAILASGYRGKKTKVATFFLVGNCTTGSTAG